MLQITHQIHQSVFFILYDQIIMLIIYAPSTLIVNFELILYKSNSNPFYTYLFYNFLNYLTAYWRSSKSNPNT